MCLQSHMPQLILLVLTCCWNGQPCGRCSVSTPLLSEFPGKEMGLIPGLGPHRSPPGQAVRSGHSPPTTHPVGTGCVRIFPGPATALLLCKQ